MEYKVNYMRNDKLFLGTNTKMYKNISDTVSFLERLKEKTLDITDSRVELFVLPSFTTLYSAARCLEGSRIKFGAQNIHWEDQGQFTGEISPVMLREAGCEIAEIGHSERRHVMGETDAVINKKVLAALRHNMIGLLCVGETGEQKALGITEETLRIQIKTGLNGVDADAMNNIWIAYEPVWAIGVGGTPASREYADESHSLIRRILLELYDSDVGGRIPVLYGGSVNNSNAMELLSMPNIDGLFIGRSAWDADNFSVIIHEALRQFKLYSHGG
jgi:triosephosphate isomerase